jgi:hypothetical protein
LAIGQIGRAANFYDGWGWHRFQLAPPGSASTTSGIRAFSRDPDIMEVWWIGPSGFLNYHYFDERRSSKPAISSNMPISLFTKESIMFRKLFRLTDRVPSPKAMSGRTTGKRRCTRPRIEELESRLTPAPCLSTYLDPHPTWSRQVVQSLCLGDTVEVDHSVGMSQTIIRSYTDNTEIRLNDSGYGHLGDPIDITIQLLKPNETLKVEATFSHAPVLVAVQNSFDTINISPSDYTPHDHFPGHNLNNIQGWVAIDYVDPPLPNSYNFNVFDQANPMPMGSTYVLEGSNLSRLGTAGVFWDTAMNAGVHGGSGPNTFNIYNVRVHTTLDASGGPAIQNVNVKSTSAPLDIIGGSSTRVVEGDRAWCGLRDIQGPVRVSGRGTVLILDNLCSSAGSTGDSGSRNVTLSTHDSIGSVTGLAPAELTYSDDLNRVVVYGGSAGNNFTILNTLVWTILNSGDGDDSISIMGTSAPLDVLGAGGNNTIHMLPGTYSGPVTIDGGDGSNTLDYSAYTGTVLVNLVTGTATGNVVGISRIQTVVGGSGGGGPGGSYNVLVGNGGNTLVGGKGRRNLLIAGQRASTLYGGDDDDILIGGTTAYDGDPSMSQLQAIMKYWAGTTDSYGTRVYNLLNGVGVPRLDFTTVHNNGGGNTMLGYNWGPTEMNLFYGRDPAWDFTDVWFAGGEQYINV